MRDAFGQPRETSKSVHRDEEPIALIAGAGRFPEVAAHLLRASGSTVVGVGFNGLTSAALEASVSQMHWLDLGQIEALASKLRASQIRRILLLGKFSQPLIFSGNTIVSFDSEAKRLLAESASQSEDGLMGIIASWLENQGFEILDQGFALASMLVPCEILTVTHPSHLALEDLRIGWPLLASLGGEGVGQCVLMRQGTMLERESVEGTDHMIRSAGASGAAGSTLIKAARPAQDRRFDLPAVGPDTLRAMREAGVCALALEANATLMLDTQQCLAEADQAGIAIWGFDPGRIGS